MFHENEFEFLKDAFEKCGLRVTTVSPFSPLLDVVDERDKSFFEKILSHDMTVDKILGGVNPNTIYKFKDSFSLSYISLLLPRTSGCEVAVIGPFLHERFSDSHILELCEKNGLGPKHQKLINEFCASLIVLPPYSPIYVVLDTFCERIWGTGYKTIDVVEELSGDNSPTTETNGREIDEILFETKNMERRYAFENEIMDAVTIGSESKLNRLFSPFNDAFFEKRVADPIRNAKNYGIIMNTLLRKAAERGGVHPIHLDKLSSEFALKIEEYPSVEKGRELMIVMFKSYCRLVREHSFASYSPLVKFALSVIESDPSSELSLSTLSNKLNVSNVYLSTIFHRETGKTITEYINDKRISYAKKLLCTTSLQVQTIAIHCGMADVHYFSKLFKKKTGKTPSEFRIESKGAK